MSQTAVLASPVPTAFARSRSLGFDECLYRSHRGEAVVLDIEGTGTYTVSGPVQVFAEGDPADPVGHYAEHIYGVRVGAGDVQWTVRSGEPSRELDPLLLGPSVEGSGWVVSSDGPVELDGSGEMALESAYPAPFFRSATGSNLVIVGHSSPAIVSDCVTTEDLEGKPGRAWRVQNASEPALLSSHFPTGRPHAALVFSHLNVASMSIRVVPANAGVVLCRTYDAFHGRQRARVMVDGEPVGIWYCPDQDRGARWRTSLFGVPASHTYGKDRITVAIDPQAGSPLWSFQALEVWSLLPG